MKGIEDPLDLGIVPFDQTLQLLQLLGQFLVRRREVPGPDERSHDRDFRLDGAPTAQDGGKHGHALLREGEWEEPSQMASRMDHVPRDKTSGFLFRKLEHEILRKIASIPFDLLPEMDRLHSVKLREMAIQHDALPADEVDLPLDVFDGEQGAHALIYE